jgi:hypothetical protein
MLKRFLFAFFAFIGLIVPAAFALALLAAPPASPAPLQRDTALFSRGRQGARRHRVVQKRAGTRA